MSLNKLIIIFGIILVIFAGIVFFQFSAKPAAKKTATVSGPSVVINDQTFKVELANTSEKQIMGLSGRDSLPSNEGMLFVFDKEDNKFFWMKKMKFPIDIIFIKGDKIAKIVNNAKPPGNLTDENMPKYSSDQPVDKVLEINSGLSDKYNIKKGDIVKINL